MHNGLDPPTLKRNTLQLELMEAFSTGSLSYQITIDCIKLCKTSQHTILSFRSDLSFRSHNLVTGFYYLILAIEVHNHHGSPFPKAFRCSQMPWKASCVQIYFFRVSHNVVSSILPSVRAKFLPWSTSLCLSCPSFLECFCRTGQYTQMTRGIEGPGALQTGFNQVS